MERREFLAGLSTSAVLAGASRLPSILSFEGIDAVTSSSMRYSHFERWLGTEFRVYDHTGRFADKVRLLAIEDGPCCDGLEQFSVVFEGTLADALPETIWRLTNGKDPGMNLSLVPTAVGTRPRYRATFSLLLPV